MVEVTQTPTFRWMNGRRHCSHTMGHPSAVTGTILTGAVTWLSLHIMWCHKSQTQRHILWVLFMFRVNKSIATESTWVVDRLWGRGRRSDCLSEQDSLVGWWNVLEMDGGEGCISLGNTKCHWIVHFMFMLYDHYFKKSYYTWFLLIWVMHTNSCEYLVMTPNGFMSHL